MNNPITFQRAEGAVLFIVATFLYFHFGFEVWQFIVLLLIFDLSMVGYFFNSNIGAVLYNIGHSLVWPMLFVAVYAITESDGWLWFSLIWFAHIGMDRALGYGLKESSDFTHTHLGNIGKKVDSHPTPNSLLKKRK